jgi:hypothetical protein
MTITNLLVAEMLMIAQSSPGQLATIPPGTSAATLAPLHL